MRQMRHTHVRSRMKFRFGDKSVYPCSRLLAQIRMFDKMCSIMTPPAQQHCDHEYICVLFRYGSQIAKRDGTPCMRNHYGCKTCEHDTREYDTRSRSMLQIPHFVCPNCGAHYIPRVEDPVKCARCQAPLRNGKKTRETAVIRNTQRTIKAKATGNYPAASAEEWMRQSCPDMA